MDAKEIYRVIESFRSPEWKKFAKTHLRLLPGDIEQAEHHDPNDLREQKYQMVHLWQNRNGREASIAALEVLIERFHNPIPHDNGGQPGRCIEQPQVQNRSAQQAETHHPSTPREGNAARITKENEQTGAPNQNPIESTATPVSGDQQQAAFGSQRRGTEEEKVPPFVEDVQTPGSQAPIDDPKQEEIQSATFTQQSSVEAMNEKQKIANKASLLLSMARPSPEGSSDLKNPWEFPAGVNSNPGSFNSNLQPQEMRKTFGDDQPTPIEKVLPGNTELYNRLCQEVGELEVDYCPKPKVDQLKNDPSHYEMKHHVKGYVLIFNNSFEGQHSMERKGSLIDVENLKKLWEKIGCRVVTDGYNDLNANEILHKFKQFVQSTKRSPCDFVCFFIMSHGNSTNGEEYFFGADHESVKVSEILAMLNNDFEATTLRGIPKLLFLQFCRGEKLDAPVQADGLGGLFPSISKIPNLAEGISADIVETDGRKPWLPTQSDILISYATQFGYKAIRETANGSWFINAIVNTFSKFASREHVLDMMTRVNNAVSLKTGTLGSGEVCKEMSECRMLLRKKLYLLPGHVENENEF